MASVVQIVIEVDDKGAVHSVEELGATMTKKLDPAFQKIGQRGNVVMTQMRKDNEKAREAVQLLSNTIGVQVPRSLEKVIAKTPGVAGALRGAFELTVIAAFGAAIIKAVSNLDEARVALNKFKETARIAFQQFAEAFLGKQAGPELQLQRYNKQMQILLPLIQVETSLRRQANSVTLQGFAAIEEKRVQERADIESLAQKQIQAAKDVFSTTVEFTKAKEAIEQARIQALGSADRKAQAERLAQARQNQIAIADAEEQIAIARSSGLAQIEAEIKAQLSRVEAAKQAGLDIDVAEKQITAIRIKGTRQVNDVLRGIEEETLSFREQKYAEGADGIRAVELQLEAELRQIAKREEELFILLPGRRAAAEEAAAEKVREIRRRAAEDTLRLETQAAIAVLPPWQRADAEILASAEQRIREIEEQLRRSTINSDEAARQTAAVWTRAYAEMRDRVAASLESLFDDITSGNIGRRFLNNFKRLLFQMVAEWLLALAKMRAASAGGFGGGPGSILGAIFSGLLGIPNIFGASATRSSGVSAATTGSTASGIASGGLSLGAGLGGPLGLGAGISSLPISSSMTPSAISALLGGGLSAGGGVTSALSLPAGASFGSRIAAGLGGLIPSGLLGLAGLVGFGGPGQGLLSGLLGAAGLGGLFAVSTGAGFGVGALGSLAAFFSSALGAATLGIGAVVGLLFGILGGGKKKRERERLEGQLVREIQKVEEAYKQHQLDFDSTIGQLESLRVQFVQAQKQVGGGPHRRVHSHIDKAEAEIRAIEDERKRRQEVVFGPAEFHRGGVVASHLALTSPGRAGARAFHSGDVVNANLLTDESVLNRSATARLGKVGVDRLNSGGGIGGPSVVQIYAMDAKSFEGWLNSTGGKAFLRYLRRADAEGAF